MDRIGIHNNRALLNLAVVVNVPVVHADGLDASGTDLDKNPVVVDGEVANPDQLIALGNIGELAGVDIVGVGGDSNFAFAGLFVVHDVPVVNADFLGGGLLNNLQANVDIAVHDGQVADLDELIAFRDGDLAGVDMDGVGGEGDGLLLHLLVVGLVVEIESDLLGGGDGLQTNVDIAVIDGQVTSHGELIAFDGGDVVDADMDGVGGDGDGLLLHLNTVDLVVVIEGDLLGGGLVGSLNLQPVLMLRCPVVAYNSRQVREVKDLNRRTVRPLPANEPRALGGVSLSISLRCSEFYRCVRSQVALCKGGPGIAVFLVFAEIDMDSVDNLFLLPLGNISGIAVHGLSYLRIPTDEVVTSTGRSALKCRSGGAGQEVLVFLIWENLLVIHAIGVGDGVLGLLTIGNVIVVLVFLPSGGVSGVAAHGFGHLGIPASKNIILAGGVAVFVKGDTARIKRRSGSAGCEVFGHLIRQDLLVIYAVGVGDSIFGLIFYGHSEGNGLLIPIAV